MGQHNKGRVLILGVGNLLLGDEGVGIHAVREMEKLTLPAGVDVEDGATGGLQLLDSMAGYERVIVVDAVDGGQEPGAIFRFAPQAVIPEPSAVPISLHQTEVLSVLRLASWLGKPLPPVVVYGIQPQTIDWSTELSPPVLARLPEFVDAILREAQRQIAEVDGKVPCDSLQRL
jgi:hydrogenase maturation protease